ncbi:IS5 family transposase [Actinocatenispora thailandica]|uniref:IS5 family transposase n=1 Tax=Actinocatenispora thailandica TaxID=227318 RepID=UPI001950B20B|nr:IS5 family transposase [Actinocatenispora thailandica]
MDDRLAKRLVPDGLWEIVAPLLPAPKRRRQGGGLRPVDDRAVFTAIVYVLTSGCAWRHLPAEFGVSTPTAHRRFQAWTRAGVWRRLHVAVLDQLGAAGEVDWSRVVADGAVVRAKRGALTGRNPVDRGKKGSKIHVLADRTGLPLAVAISAANTHDSLALEPLVQAIPAIRSRRGRRRRRPDKLHADKGYDFPHLRAMLRQRRITPRIARRGIEPSDKLGRHRWIIESCIAWLFGRRRLTIRYERYPHLFLGLAAALICYNRLTK